MKMWCIQYWGTLLILLMMLAPLAAAAEETLPPPMIAVSPSIFELEIGSTPSVHSLRVLNFGKEPVEVQVSLATWDLDEQNHVRLLDPDEQSLDQWIVINPLRFTIESGKSQSVRFSIRPRVRPEPGEHRAMIYLDQQLSEESEAQMRVKFRIGVAVYGTVGEVARVGELHSVELAKGSNPIKAGLQISSKGTANVRIDGQYAVWQAALYPGLASEERDRNLVAPDAVLPEAVVDADKLPGIPVLAGDCRQIWFQAGKPLPAGNYILDLDFDLDKDSFDRAVPFTVSAEAAASGSPESE
jgi:hypothetical protein